jgi:predicted aspartyl protease
LRKFILAWTLLIWVAGCGHGRDGDTAPNAANVQTITVDGGPTNSVNTLFTTVTICPVGSSASCQSIDHVLVDTGSTGLRLVSSVVTLALTQQVDVNKNPILNCGQFAGSHTWGPVKIADVKMSGEVARSVPIQLIGDPAYSAVPTTCSSSTPLANTVQTLGANGVLGVGLFLQDCGIVCASSAQRGFYYICPLNVCTSVAMNLASQLQNPVGLFSADNNGLIISLPSVPSTGAASAKGQMIFGIGTQTNNGFGNNVQIISVDPSSGYFTTVLGGTTVLTNSLIDTGSNGLFFTVGLTACNNTAQGFYCPATTQGFSATMGAVSRIVNFQIANAVTQFTSNPGFTAFPNVGGTNVDPSGFDWGLPFFFGRTVYLAFAGATSPVGAGPFIAF